jgi:hypothetical protein
MYPRNIRIESEDLNIASVEAGNNLVMLRTGPTSGYQDMLQSAMAEIGIFPTYAKGPIKEFKLEPEKKDDFLTTTASLILNKVGPTRFELAASC